MTGGSGGLRGGELKGGIVQQFGKSIAVNLKAFQLQTTLDTLDPLASKKVGGFVKCLLGLAQVSAQSFTVIASVSIIDPGSCKLAFKFFNTLLLALNLTACISVLHDKTGELIGGDFGVVLVRFRNVDV
jgi:hypothetical protein